MNILLAHNYYQQPGGEDQVFQAEAELLSRQGHKVERFSIHNDQVKEMSSLELSYKMLWNSKVAKTLKTLIQKHDIQVAHFHNTLPLISPAAYAAAQSLGVPVVQTLHNFRLVCPKSSLYREAKVCELCLKKPFAYPGIIHRCYRDSAVASLGVASIVSLHRLIRSYKRNVNAFIALTPFAKAKLVEGGWPKEKIFVKPNFLVTDPGFTPRTGAFALFVGRLVEEKGILPLLEAWQGHSLPLKIVGGGPLDAQVQQAAKNNPAIDYLGYRPRQEVLQLMKEARCLVFPSLWYEGFPMTLLEAFAVGLPVVASNLGSMASLIQHGINGLHIEAGNAADIKTKVEVLFEDEKKALELAQQARRDFETHYSAKGNYKQLSELYQSLIRGDTHSG